MSRFADAVFHWMQKQSLNHVSSNDLWSGLQKEHPELTEISEQRKTPRTTMMRDLRKDKRFTVRDRKVSLKLDNN